jgi:hypothetical protein
MGTPDVTKVSGVAVYRAIATIGLSAKGTLDQQVARLDDYFSAGDAPTIPCDYCGGFSPDDSPDGCPFCGTPDDQDEPDLKRNPPGPAAQPKEIEVTKPSKTEIVPRQHQTVQTVAMLDEVVEEIRKLRQEDAANAWQISLALKRIWEEDLWKLRRTEHGEVVYKNFEALTRAEFGFGRKYAQDQIRIVQEYTEEQFRDYGPTKLRTVLQQPKKDRAALLGQLQQGASRSEIEEPQRARGGKKPAKKARKPEVEQDADTGKITVATTLGRSMVKLLAKPLDGQDPREARQAVSLKDVPWGHLDLANDVRMFFTVLVGADGKLVARFDFKRQK